MVRQCVGLGLAVTRRFEALGANHCKLSLGGLHLGAEPWIGLQSSDGGSSYESPFDHIAVPMDVTDDTAFTECPATGKNCICLRSGSNFTQDKRPGPADSRMPGRVGTILPQVRFLVRRAGGLIVLHKWAPTLVLILGRVGGKARIGKGSAQQHVEVWACPAL